MALSKDTNDKRLDATLQQEPKVTIFLKPIAPPAALGLAGFAASTWIASSWIANWWGTADSPTIFFPFVMTFGGLAQFIAGLFGFAARDTLVTVINTMWGAFWIAIGILYFLVADTILEPHSIHVHFPELASWFIVLTMFTWSCALAATARDLVLAGVLFSLAIGSTIACCLFAYGTGVDAGIKAAAYFFMLSALLAWWRTTAYLVEEAFGVDHYVTKLFPIFRLPLERNAPYVIPGLGEPGVKRGVPKPLPTDVGMAKVRTTLERTENGSIIAD